MRLGFDVSQTGAGRTGTGMMTHYLMRALAALDRENEYLCYPAFGDLFWEMRPDTIRPPRQDNFRIHLKMRSFDTSRRFWRDPPEDFERRLGEPDIVQSNNFFCPKGLTRAKLIYFLYDLAFLADPTFSTRDNRVGCFAGVYGASLRADMILAISDYTREHFTATFPHYPKERIRTVLLASRFTDADVPAKRPDGLSRLEPGRFWLCVGTIEPRKNHLRLMEAYRTFLDLTGADMPLVLAGAKGWLMDGVAGEVTRLNLAKHLILPGYLSDAELAWLYANCFGLAYPSLFEGFGLPVVEAMSLGAPVITANVSSLPEVAGDAALLVDPFDAAGIAGALTAVYADPALRARLVHASRERAKVFSWEKAAKSVLGHFQDVLTLPKLAGY